MSLLPCCDNSLHICFSELEHFHHGYNPRTFHFPAASFLLLELSSKVVLFLFLFFIISFIYFFYSDDSLSFKMYQSPAKINPTFQISFSPAGDGLNYGGQESVFLAGLDLQPGSN